MAAQYNTNDVSQLIDRFMKAYESRNIDLLAQTVARDADFVAYGTDEGEYWHGWESYRSATEKLFGALDEIHWKRGTPMIRFSTDGKVAWFAEDLHGKFLTGGETHECNLRLTGIAENRNGQWTIVQFHRSVPFHPHAVPYLETHGVRFD
ncbi:MAG: nuclear transport factor 2 family protein [Proteobacteria bacterium]|nr:nuclear transport factor 2 family protein [Pseudomonadota bacterium]